jgi:hypothetical protein
MQRGGNKRNKERFPADFVFQLTAEENEFLKSQTVMSKSGRGGRVPHILPIRVGAPHLALEMWEVTNLSLSLRFSPAVFSFWANQNSLRSQI